MVCRWRALELPRPKDGVAGVGAASMVADFQQLPVGKKVLLKGIERAYTLCKQVIRSSSFERRRRDSGFSIEAISKKNITTFRFYSEEVILSR